MLNSLLFFAEVSLGVAPSIGLFEGGWRSSNFSFSSANLCAGRARPGSRTLLKGTTPLANDAHGPVKSAISLETISSEAEENRPPSKLSDCPTNGTPACSAKKPPSAKNQALKARVISSAGFQPNNDILVNQRLVSAATGRQYEKPLPHDGAKIIVRGPKKIDSNGAANFTAE